MTAAVGLSLSFFETPGLEVKAAITGLVFLLMIQLQFIISRTSIKKDKPLPPPAARQPSPSRRKPTAGKKPKQKKPAIDSSVFSNFQKNLTQSTAADSDKQDDETDVVVSISSKGKSKNGLKAGKPTKVPASPKPPERPPVKVPASAGKLKQSVPGDIPVEPIGSIFDDIAEPPEIASGKIDPVKLPPKKLEALKTEEKSTPGKAEKVEGEIDAPLSSNEILTQDDFKPNEETLRNEAEIALSLAESYFNKKEYEKSLSALKQLLENEDLAKSDPDTVIKMIRLKGDCELELKQFELASKTLQDYFKNNISNQHPEFLDQLEEAISKFVDADQQQYAVHFLFTALNEFRQLHEFHKMDELYAEIESAYDQKQDLPRLTQTYQNHLAIKKTIKDFNGQLDILDQLGKLLYDQGDDEGSRKCYEQRLAIESQMEKS